MTTSRYHRQTLLPDWGDEGQARLGASRAVVVGVGALGCVIAEHLARAGVGRLTLVDRDVVERTNLQRQTLFTEADADEATPKAEAARRRLGEVNSEVGVEAVVADFRGRNAERLVGAGSRASGPGSVLPDQPPVPGSRCLIIDGTDNFETRFVLNDLAVKHGLPYVYGGAVGTRGMVMVVDPRDEWRPCLRCLFRDVPPPGSQPTCDTAGVLAPAVGVIGSMQAAEAIKLMLGAGESVSRELVEIDLWVNTHRRVPLDGARDPACPCCAERRFEFLDGDRGGGQVSLCGRDAVQVSPGEGGRVDLPALAQRLAAHGSFNANRFLVRGTLEESALSLTVFADGRAIVNGTDDPARARAIYARYVGA
ncbi:MAG: thiamine biosynthesis protein ThiF [Phycisphaerae bacterium]|nr:thiamine biosynthesis protein ThiF [Phycisphaerae bacterium]